MPKYSEARPNTRVQRKVPATCNYTKPVRSIRASNTRRFKLPSERRMQNSRESASTGLTVNRKSRALTSLPSDLGRRTDGVHVQFLTEFPSALQTQASAGEQELMDVDEPCNLVMVETVTAHPTFIPSLFGDSDLDTGMAIDNSSPPSPDLPSTRDLETVKLLSRTLEEGVPRIVNPAWLHRLDEERSVYSDLFLRTLFDTNAPLPPTEVVLHYIGGPQTLITRELEWFEDCTDFSWSSSPTPTALDPKYQPAPASIACLANGHTLWARFIREGLFSYKDLDCLVCLDPSLSSEDAEFNPCIAERLFWGLMDIEDAAMAKDEEYYQEGRWKIFDEYVYRWRTNRGCVIEPPSPEEGVEMDSETTQGLAEDIGKTLTSALGEYHRILEPARIQELDTEQNPAIDHFLRILFDTTVPLPVSPEVILHCIGDSTNLTGKPDDCFEDRKPWFENCTDFSYSSSPAPTAHGRDYQPAPASVACLANGHTLWHIFLTESLNSLEYMPMFNPHLRYKMGRLARFDPHVAERLFWGFMDISDLDDIDWEIGRREERREEPIDLVGEWLQRWRTNRGCVL